MAARPRQKMCLACTSITILLTALMAAQAEGERYCLWLLPWIHSQLLGTRCSPHTRKLCALFPMHNL